MKAIETLFQGYRFRSRLEARWATFFDALELPWNYESEGYQLENGQLYLPDFNIDLTSQHTAWYEVRPRGSLPDGKFSAFQSECQCATFLAGDPVDVFSEWFDSEFLHGASKVLSVCPRCCHIAEHAIAHTEHFVEIDCWPCDIDTPTGGDNPPEKGRLCNVTPHKGTLRLTYGACAQWLAAVTSAAYAARGARFEYGECGVRK